MDLKTITLSIAQIAEEKGIPKEKVLETMEQALAAAYKKEFGKRGQRIEAKIDPKTGQLEFWQLKEVVTEEMIYSEEELEELRKKEEKEGPAIGVSKEDEGEEEEEEAKVRFNPERHLMLEEAQKIEAKIKPGETIKLSLKTEQDFGRIATQTAKQVILQRLREAEREAILAEYASKEGEIVSGIVQQVEPESVYLDMGKTVGLLPRAEQVPGEFYRPGQRLKMYVLKAESTPKGPRILLSRAYPKLVSKLFELEVPEIASGQIEIKSIAREPGSRSKIAVFSTEQGLDPVGSCIGQRGSRVGAVMAELGGEKIDIIEYAEDPAKYIQNALSPAKVLEVKILPKNKALCLVPQDQLSLAIGREGQNVRLAAKLTGWKIDVRGPEGEATESKVKKEQERGEEKEEGKEKEEKKTEPAGAKTEKVKVLTKKEGKKEEQEEKEGTREKAKEKKVEKKTKKTKQAKT